MTPWGIRNRIKSALGKKPTEREESLSLTIVLPDGSENRVSAERRYTLVMASQALETPIATGCPDGHCGGCAVDVLDGTGLSSPTDAERKLIGEKAKPGQRLACHARVEGNGAKVKVYQTWSMDVTKGEA